MSVTRRYYRGHNLVAMRDGLGNQSRYFHFDHQGTTQCLTDSSGAVTDRFASDACGVEVRRTGTSLNRQWYIGKLGYYQEIDEAKTYVRARWLAPSLGAWMTKDPENFTPPIPRVNSLLDSPLAYRSPRSHDRHHRYAYAENAPTRFADPSGLTVYWHTKFFPQPASWTCPAGSAGWTDCDPGSASIPYGKVWSAVCVPPQNWGPHKCLKVHEGVHRDQLRECCQRYGKCLFKQSLGAICGTKYLDWTTAIRAYVECQAYRETVDCAWGEGRSHHCFALIPPDPARCIELEFVHIPFWIDKRDRNCAIAMFQTCPFHPDGRIRRR